MPPPLPTPASLFIGAALGGSHPLGVGYKSCNDASTSLMGGPYVWSSRRDIFITCCHVMSCHHVTTGHQGTTCHYVTIKSSTR